MKEAVSLYEEGCSTNQGDICGHLKVIAEAAGIIVLDYNDKPQAARALLGEMPDLAGFVSFERGATVAAIAPGLASSHRAFVIALCMAQHELNRGKDLIFRATDNGGTMIYGDVPGQGRLLSVAKTLIGNVSIADS